MTKSPESQGKTDDKKGRRQRNYAFVVYPDSALPDWMERMADAHIPALISPIHDQDINPDGTPKKPHWHVLWCFEGVKTRPQVDALREQILGPDYNRALEEVSSLRGYARYLTHRDNPEKAQYSPAGVRGMGGMDYEATCSLPSDDYKMLAEIFTFVRTNDIRNFADLIDICMVSNPDWFALIVNRRTYVVKEYIKSYTYSLRDIGVVGEVGGER